MRGALKASFDNSSLAKTVFEFCSEERRSLYIIGSTAENATKFCSFVTDEYPQLPVLGCREGYFASGEERDLVIREIVDINPDVLVVGMGAAIQEEFLSDVRSAGWVGLGFTCGGFIHQTALRGKKFYPDLVVKLGLRWLFRLLFERGLVNRYTVGALRFLLVFSVSFQRLRRNKGYIL
jgi:N-acetylglucosaminyldiphosphoundecaprenol N-acetyl-beta-D-mannosaminyltransferase